MPFVEFKGDEIEFPYNMSGDEIQDVLGAIASSATATSEFMLTLGTGAIAEPVAGLAGLATGSADNVRRVQSMLTYQPRTAAGQKAMQRIGQDLASMAEETGLDNVSGYWRDRVVPALQQQAGPIAGSMLAAGGLAALTLMSEAGGGGVAGRPARAMGRAEVGAVGDLSKISRDVETMNVGRVTSGNPLSVNYARNTNPAPNFGSQYGQDIEPAGRYMNIHKGGAPNPVDGLEYGEILFNRPLVIDNDDLKWKRSLSDIYGGQTGKKLSQAIADDGYDGIVTLDYAGNGKPYTSETIDLSMFSSKKTLPIESIDEIKNPL